MPTAMATQFIMTFNAKRFVLAIGYSVSKLQDTTGPPLSGWSLAVPNIPQSTCLLTSQCRDGQ
jgi:hypothetical protein